MAAYDSVYQALLRHTPRPYPPDFETLYVKDGKLGTDCQGRVARVDAWMPCAKVPKSVVLVMQLGVHSFPCGRDIVVSDYTTWLVKRAGLDLARTLDGPDDEASSDDDLSDACSSVDSVHAGTVLEGIVRVVERLW